MYFHHGKVLFTLRKKFYPLGYKEKELIEWKSLKLRKAQTMQ
jgi:predicted NUDIX family phosphoesterase